MNGENVGNFSPTEHISFYEYARAINRATNDVLDISKEYNFLKVIRNPNGQDQLTYCNQQGNEYKNTQEYKEQALRLMSKYDENLTGSYDKQLENLDQEKQNKYSEVSNEYRSRKVSYEEYVEKFRSIPSWYEQSKDSLLDNAIRNGLREIRTSKSIDIDKILNELVNINPNLLTKDIDLTQGKVFALKTPVMD